MKVRINGETVDIDGHTLADAVAGVSSAERGVAVAVNGEVVPRRQWDRELDRDDRVEVLAASQGG